MSQTAVVAWLAVRELWITFRLLVVLVAFVVAGAVVALLPSPLPATMARLALGLAGAAALSGAIAAWCLAEEREFGRAGWLVTRSVPRWRLVAGWFIAIGAVATGGSAAALLLGWLSASAVALRLEPGPFALAGLHAALATLALVAVGLLAGATLRRIAATLATVAVAGAATASAWVSPGTLWWSPGAGFARLALLGEGPVGVSEALRGAGATMLLVALLLVAARVALERAEL